MTSSPSSSPSTASEWIASKENKNHSIDSSSNSKNTNMADNQSCPTNTTNTPELGPTGCYLVYEAHSGGRLLLHYSEGTVPDNAVGFWCPGPHHTIPPFKFKQNAGRAELIKGIAGGDANRRKYFSGWCQFLKLAVSKGGLVIQFRAEQGVAVDVYGYNAEKQQPLLLELELGLVDMSHCNAVAVMPRGHEFMKGVKTMASQTFLEKGNLAGASSTM